MVNVNELRIGNYIDIDYAPATKITLDFFRAMAEGVYNEEDLNPIPVTPEILEKCGFEGDVWSDLKINEYHTITLGRCASENGLPYAVILKQENTEGFTIKEAAEIQKENNDFKDEGFLLKGNISFVTKPIRCLHQLQNLYFALTGEELTLHTSTSQGTTLPAL